MEEAQLNPTLQLVLIVAAVCLVTGGIVGAFVMAITVAGSDRRHGTIDFAPAAARGELPDLGSRDLEVDGGWDWPVAPRTQA